MNAEPHILPFAFESFLMIAAGVLSVLMTGLFYYVRRGHAISDQQWIAIEKIQRGQNEQSILLTRIEVRLDNYDDLKKNQEHDHRAIRDLDRLTDDLRHRVQNLEDNYKDLNKFCQSIHGSRIPMAKD